MALYSPDVFTPDWFVAPTQRVQLNYTAHADRARRDDRYGVIPKFASIPLHKFRVVEFETDDNNNVIKYVVRGKMNDEFACIFVLVPEEPAWAVKTVWLNRNSDTHCTLDRSRYVGG